MGRKKNKPESEVVDTGGAPGPSVLETPTPAPDPYLEGILAKVETPAPAPAVVNARFKAADFLHRVATNTLEYCPASPVTRVEAIDALAKAGWGPRADQPPMPPDIEKALVELMDPPSDLKDRVRAARLLLGV